MTDLERLARILEKAWEDETDSAFPSHAISSHELRTVCRAVLTALREPSEAMLRALDHEPGFNEYGKGIWQDCIDTVLSEGE